MELTEKQLEALRYLKENDKFDDVINACTIASATSGETLSMALGRHLTLRIEVRDLMNKKN